jgi:hypothetical protein
MSYTTAFGKPLPVKELTEDHPFPIGPEQFEAGIQNDPYGCAGVLGILAHFKDAKKAYVGSGGDVLILIEKKGEEPHVVHGVLPTPDARALTDVNDLGDKSLMPKKTVSVTLKAPKPSLTYDGRRERDQKYRKGLAEKATEASVKDTTQVSAEDKPSRKPRQTREVRVGLKSRPRPGISAEPTPSSDELK